ncbi:MAG: septum formation protein Maf [Muribaculaceae bacterium]|nr:septum formation protein Maf [Muribaculaceae bacterium]
MKIILASNSPRRRELLADLGYDFEVKVLAGIDESYPPTLPVADIAAYISRKKADAYRPTLAGDELVITADTIVVLGNEVMGKPHDATDARRMLHSLSGKEHHVITGVTVTTRDRQSTFSVTSTVEFATLDADEIDYYVARYSPLDKAGAYGIQEWIGCMGVKRIEGSFYNVMGLPLHRLYTVLKEYGVRPR